MSQRKRLFALVFAVTAPLLLLAAAFVVISVRDAQDRAEQESEAIARAGAVAAGSFIDGHVRALQAVSAGVRHAPDLTEDELREEILLRLGVNPEWDGMSVVDSNGIVLAGSRPDSTGIDLSGRAYLQEMFATGRPAVSDGVLTIGEGVPSILIAAPVRFSDGTTGGVIGQLTLSTISDALTRSLTTDARVGLIDSAGQTLIHSDPTRAAALTQVSDRPEVVAGHRGEAGTVEVDRNGRSTLVAYAPVEPLGWVVTVAEDSSAAFANADAIARRGAFLIGIALVAVVACGWYVGSRMGRSYDELQAARTAEAEARERAEAALRSRDEFISIASHELRNPVAAIRGFGQLMQRRLARGTLAGDDLHEYIDSIASSGAYLSRLVEDLLSVSRLEGGRMDLRLETVDVAEVVRRATIESPLKEHSLVIDQPTEPLVTSLDADRITQVLVNLLENAAKYSPAGSEIRLTVALDADEVRISVSDSGIGLPPDELARLFAPFGRATNAREANIPGLGLGLYVSRRLAEAHGGTLLASSAGVGRGSTFTLVLPFVEAPTTDPPPPTSDDPGTPANVSLEAGKGAPA
ncbi:MAG: sensor histidine kinase [Dehalococcoidia bacterium]|nr:sensor histidine kinase [Dehalococcoidia bacterium]